MMNVLRVLKSLSLAAIAAALVGCASTAALDAPASANLFGATSASVAASPATGKASRLRFKNGPLCLCSDGLQEDDILKSLNAKP